MIREEIFPVVESDRGCKAGAIALRLDVLSGRQVRKKAEFMTGKSYGSLDKTAQQVLDTLDRWSDRLRGHHSQKRGQERKPFRDKMTVYLPGNKRGSGEAQDNVILETWPRNVSRSGASFVCQKPIKADEVIVCLDFGEGNSSCFRSEIVRRRRVQEGLWEFGVKFLERLNL